VGFTETEFDELPYARMVANHCRTNHHETIVSIQDALNDLPRLIWHADEPHGDSALVPTFAVSRFAASHVRVILSGLGGDELFGGYGRYFDGYPSEHLYRRLPLGLRSIMTRLAQPFSAFAPHLLERFRLNSMYDADRYVAKISVFQKQMRERLLGCLDDETESLALMFDHLPNADAANRLMYVDLLSYLADDLLHITDRMTMAVSLEARTPFLDYRLVEFAAGLPSSHKLDWRNRNTKICLKAAVAPVLPEAILTRKKWGFGSPVSRWMENGLSDTVQALFRNSELVRLGLIETKAVQQYLRHPVPGEGRLRYQRLWSLLALEIWAVCFGKGQREKPGFGLADLT
jgi:asparagine synthase (glutamine-hydrolysing)